MFYKALGYTVWKLGVRYVRKRYGRTLRVALVAGIISLLAAGYLATRSGEET
jgi:hypothetical protein